MPVWSVHLWGERSVCWIVANASKFLGYRVSSAGKYFSSTSLLTTCKLKISFAYHTFKLEQQFMWRAEDPPLIQALLLCPVPASKAEGTFSNKRVPQPQLWEIFYFSISSLKQLRAPLAGRTGRDIWRERKRGMAPDRHAWHFCPSPLFLLHFSKKSKARGAFLKFLIVFCC